MRYLAHIIIEGGMEEGRKEGGEEERGREIKDKNLYTLSSVCAKGSEVM